MPASEEARFKRVVNAWDSVESSFDEMLEELRRQLEDEVIDDAKDRKAGDV